MVILFLCSLLQADVLTVKNAVSSAVDIMQAMGSSVCHLLSKVSSEGPVISTTIVHNSSTITLVVLISSKLG
jgi:hypothetical protein